MIALYILIGLFGLALLFSALTYYITFYTPHKNQLSVYNIPKGDQYKQNREVMHRLIDEMDKRPYERVFTRSRDGLLLSGRYYESEAGAPLAICFHGYRGSAVRDFCGGGVIALEAGYNTLVIDERGHGESEGHTISFGVKEKYDVLSWVDYATRRFGRQVKIVLCGISMGASTVLLASALPLPENVVGISADCPYSSPSAIIRKVCRDRGIPPFFVYPFIALGALLFGRFRLGGDDVINAVSNAALPILLIHGEDDRLVPCEMAKKIKEANPLYVDLHLFEGAGHGISYMKDYERYRTLVTAFLESRRVDQGLGVDKRAPFLYNEKNEREERQ